jgi:hypothetical protein
MSFAIRTIRRKSRVVSTRWGFVAILMPGFAAFGIISLNPVRDAIV